MTRTDHQTPLRNGTRTGLGLALTGAAATLNVLWFSLREFARTPGYGGEYLDSVVGPLGMLAIQLCGLLGGVLLFEATWRYCIEAGAARLDSRARTGTILCGLALGCVLAGVIPAVIGNGLLPPDTGFEGLLPFLAGAVAGFAALLLGVPGALCLRRRPADRRPGAVDPAVVAGILAVAVVVIAFVTLIAP